MKIAIVGSRSITVNNLGDYLPENTTEIVAVVLLVLTEVREITLRHIILN
mgnify:FL=1